jgi:hypothetical protein
MYRFNKVKNPKTNYIMNGHKFLLNPFCNRFEMHPKRERRIAVTENPTKQKLI